MTAALTSMAAALEMGGSAAVVVLLQRRQAAGAAGTPSSSSGLLLLALGLVTAGCQLLLAVGGLACVVALPPAEARLRLVGSRRRHAADTRQPLLAAGADDSGVAAASAHDSEGLAAVEKPIIFDAATMEFLR